MVCWESMSERGPDDVTFLRESGLAAARLAGRVATVILGLALALLGGSVVVAILAGLALATAPRAGGHEGPGAEVLFFLGLIAAGLSGAGALSHAIAAYAVRAAAGRATLALQGAGAPLDALPELRRVRHVATIHVAVFALLALGAVVLGLVGGAQGAAAGFVVSFVLIGGPAVLWLGTLGVGHWLGAVRAVASTS